MLFRNFYRCARCDQTWTDVWSATCDDDCPHCGSRHMSPYKSEDVDAPVVVDPLSAFDGGGHAKER
jgi:DNA-directed RNA polymerase subunit RPC12/RpoP